MHAGLDGSARNLKDPRDLVGGHAEVVMKYEHDPMVERQTSESTLELVSVDDPAIVVGGDRDVGRAKVDLRDGTPPLPRHSVAFVHAQPIGPSLEARRVPELRQVPPHRERGLLGRVAGQLGVAEDAVRKLLQASVDAVGEPRERDLVTVLSTNHEVDIHPSYRCGRLAGMLRLYMV